MAYVGFEEVKVGVFDAAGENIEEVFVWKDEDGGTVNMTITWLEKEATEVYASNKRVWISKKGTGAVTNTFETFNPPAADLDKAAQKPAQMGGAFLFELRSGRGCDLCF